jgi:hypothetical protein
MCKAVMFLLAVLFFAGPFAQGAFAHGTPSSAGQSVTKKQDNNRRDHRGSGRGDAAQTVNQVGAGATYMVVDAANNRIKIIVEGKEVAYFHKGGLHVDGAITSTVPAK